MNSKRCANFAQRYEYISDLVSGVTSRICYNVAAYNVLLNYVLIDIREVEKLLHSNFETSEPSRAEYSTFLVEDDTLEFPGKSMKQLDNPNKNKVWLMSDSEKKHLIWKQQRKLAIELQNLSCN
ncbi:hypothetical protein LIER_42931 [Lithospermum erythrorhizon]|uniref:Uncharacterized protein n=1 Tax=Lithospermum erythrorhizon TaxID=34254 RepID=A0AAV3P8D0_LITER